jgi:putative ABC transport system permease protein
MLIDLLKETVWSLSGNKARSGLTILGIVIGIASVITMVAIGQGSQQSIESSIQSIGSNLIVISPGAQRSGQVSSGRGNAQTLTIDDYNAIKAQIPNISGVAPEVSRRYQVTAKGNNTNTQVTGTVPDYLSVRNLKVDTGSFFSDLQIKSSAKVAVLGPTTRDDLFGNGVNPIGQSVKINNIEFRVVGMTQSKGGTGFNNPDDAIYVPYSTAQSYLSGNNYLSGISVAAASQNAMSAVQQQINDLLLAKHKISDPNNADFSLTNQTDIINTISSVSNTMTMLLASIAGISLLVGGIGIMNMMLTTVTERTREIGLRKAVGIRKIFINLQFLAEAVMLTFIGGIVGVALGWGAAWAITKFFSTATQVSLSSVILAFGVSAGVGIVFGFYPARRAASLSPIEALRYE